LRRQIRRDIVRLGSNRRLGEAHMPLAVTNYEFSVFIHITAVVVGFGATFAESVLFPVAMRMSLRNLPMSTAFSSPSTSSSRCRGW
jgi:hypothetical protein